MEFTVIILALHFSAAAFGVFTHEAIIDASWDKSILPLLKEKYPASTAAEQKEAHAYGMAVPSPRTWVITPSGAPFLRTLYIMCAVVTW